METILIEITEEELARLIKKREEEARREKALALLEEIKETILEIRELGYDVHTNWIGGAYVRRHIPLISPNELQIIRS